VLVDRAVCHDRQQSALGVAQARDVIVRESAETPFASFFALRQQQK
jgi:hypothetical protein